MKYVIVYLIKGPAEKYHQKLVKEVGPKFGERYMLENPLPSHVTLKSPFSSRNIRNIENSIKDFVKTQKASKMVAGKFGNFRRFVAFMKTNFSKEGRKTQKELLKILPKTMLHEFDKEWKPHATISYGNEIKTFNKIWNYLRKKKQPVFNLKFDNITILKKPGKYWKIHKIYKIR